MKYTPWLLLLLLYSPLAHSSTPDSSKNSVYVGYAREEFFYEEFDDNDAFLDGEYGSIAGPFAGINWHTSLGVLDASFARLSDEIDYDGHTQDGVDHTTTSGAEVTKWRILFKLPVCGSSFCFEPFIGYGNRYWLRQMRPSWNAESNAPVAGLDEGYEWSYTAVGASISMFVAEESLINIYFMQTQMRDATMWAEFMGYERAEVSLGENKNMQYGISWQTLLSPLTNLTVRYYRESWDIGKSNVVEIYSDGSFAGYIWEPRSETRNWGLQLAFNFLID